MVRHNIIFICLVFLIGCYPEKHITFVNKIGVPLEVIIPEHIDISNMKTKYNLEAKGQKSKVDMFCGNGSWTEQEADSIGEIIQDIELHSHDTSGFRVIIYKRKGFGKTKLQVTIK